MQEDGGDLAALDQLLGGLTGEVRSQRAELLEWLLTKGFDVDQIQRALIPMLVPVNRVIGDDGTRTTTRQVAEEHGFDEHLLRRLHLAAGFPADGGTDSTDLSRADAESVLRAKAYLDVGFDTDDVVTIVRVLAEGLGRTAEAMRKAALKAVLVPGSTELQLAEAFERLADQLGGVVGPLVTDVMLMQLRRSFETEAVSFAERTSGNLSGARKVTVAFADLVGFTDLGEIMAPEYLERTASRLVELAREAVVAPVRYVKAIGDAVMFVSTDAAALVDVVIALTWRTEELGLPRIRAGIASGSAVSHSGDWYGRPVNLASRITDVARPGSVVTSTAVREELAHRTDLHWRAFGPRMLKGIGGVQLAAVRRSGPQAEAPDVDDR
jgi:adenylate cyclase